MTNNRRSLIILAGLVLLTILVGRPLITSAHPGGHSAYVDFLRIICWHAQVEQGNFFPRWIPEFYFGHGSPIFLFYAPLSYVFIELFRPLVPTALASLKAAYLAWIFLAIVGMYALGRRLGGQAGGMAAAAVYGFAPYFLLDIYVRNGCAEFACFAILPWLFLLALRLTRAPDSWSMLGFAILFATLIATHNITALITAPVLLVFLVVLGWGANLRAALGAWLAGIGLSAWFWLPSIAEKNLVQSTQSLTGGYFHYGHHFVYLRQLLVPRWGWSPSVPGPDDNMSFQIGLVILACAAVAAALGIARRKRLGRPDATVLVLLFTAFLGAAFFTTGASDLFWRHVPLLPFVQFPWRFLLLATFAGAAIVAYVPRLIAAKKGFERSAPIVAAVIVVLAFTGSIHYVRARYIVHDATTNKAVFAKSPAEAKALLEDPNLRMPEDLLTLRNIRIMGVTTTAKNDYLPVTAGENTSGKYYGQVVQPYQGSVTLLEISPPGAPIRFSYEAATPVTVQVEPFYFPGWRAMLDKNVRLPVRPRSDTGWTLVDLPATGGVVTVRFGDTPVRTAGKVISLATLLVLGILLTLWQGRPKEAKA